MNRHIGRLLTALGAIGVSAAPIADEPRVICSRCNGTDRTGCTCESVNELAKFKAQAKRNRKNAARLLLVDRGVLIGVGAR